MTEEIISSGRNNHMIDPVLSAWGWEIPVYLFLGGLSAGILFFAGLYTILNKEKEYPSAVKVAPLLVPIFLSVGLFALFLDLHHKLYFWRLYTAFKIVSPMSWGAWTLMAVTPLSIIWAGIHIHSVFPQWKWPHKLFDSFFTYIKEYKKALAWSNIIFGVILGIYTGILFSAFNARPLWNTSILGPLFLVSGLSAAAATIVLMAKSKEERILFTKIDVMLIAIELFLLIHFIMGYLAGSLVKQESISLILGGDFTFMFWAGVVIIGLITPLILEILELKGRHIPVFISAGLVLIGSLMLRFFFTYAGQVSSF